jgi:hypothetical protein
VSGVYTNLSGASITGDLISGTSGVFTNVSGTTVTGATVSAATLNATTGTVTNLGVTTTLTGVTAIFTTGEFTAITGETLILTGDGSGGGVNLTASGVVSGGSYNVDPPGDAPVLVGTGFVIQGPLVILPD